MNWKINWSGRSHDFTDKEIETVVRVMKTADPLTQGKYLQQFESDFSKYLKQPNAFGLTNCAHALELSAILSKLSKNDEVIIPAHTYCASAIPFARTGAKIKWADIDLNTFLISLDSIIKNVTKKTKAIVVVHLYGLISPEINEICKFAKDNNIFLIEDCAQSLGAALNEKPSGTFGDIGCFSFHGQKSISTMGEGGVITVKDASLAKKIPGLRHNGHAPFSNQTNYWMPAMTNIDLDMDGVWPHNYSMSELVAALGSELLQRLPSLTSLRRKRFQIITSELQNFPELQFQKIIDMNSSSFHLLPAMFNLKNKHRDDFINLISTKFGIKTIVQYYPLYRYDLFKKMNQHEASCPNTDLFFDNMVSFPFHIWMNDELFHYMIDSIKKTILELRG